jgi:hypothetical protein
MSVSDRDPATVTQPAVESRPLLLLLLLGGASAIAGIFVYTASWTVSGIQLVRH